MLNGASGLMWTPQGNFGSQQVMPKPRPASIRLIPLAFSQRIATSAVDPTHRKMRQTFWIEPIIRTGQLVEHHYVRATDIKRYVTVSDNQIIELTADIVSAHVANNTVSTADVPVLIQSVYSALAKTSEPLVENTPRQDPAVSIRSSIKPDYLICLEDGAKLKMLKRYLRTNYDMSPEEYREKWGLPRDYPMVAPNYAEQRRTLAHQIGLGRKKVTGEVKAVAGAVRRTKRKAVEAVESAITPAAKSGAGRPRTSAKAAKAAAQTHLEGAAAPAEA